MTSQVLRRHLLRLGRYIALQNRHLTKCPLGLHPATATESVKIIQTSRCMSTKAKFEAFNVQDTQDFNERVLQSSTPVIVDFHASWCGPCKLLGPRLESIAASREGKVHLAKIDVDDHAELAMEYGVQSVPTVLGMKNGKIQDKFIGLQDDDQLKSFVEKLVN